MSARRASAEVNIHLRARARDRDVIDLAARLSGGSRSQFMLASAVKEAKQVLLDQTSVQASARAFRQILDRLDADAGAEELAGLKRLAATRPFWTRG